MSFFGFTLSMVGVVWGFWLVCFSVCNSAGCFNTSSFAGLVGWVGCGGISFAGLIMLFGSSMVGGCGGFGFSLVLDMNALIVGCPAL